MACHTFVVLALFLVLGYHASSVSAQGIPGLNLQQVINNAVGPVVQKVGTGAPVASAATATVAPTIAPVATVAVNSSAAGSPLSTPLAAGEDPLKGKLGAGWWSAVGNKLVDGAGSEVKFSGINWSGMEDNVGTPQGLLEQTLDWHLDRMASLGFNMIRLPFSSQIFTGQMATAINPKINPDLQNLTSLQLIDHIVGGAGRRGMKVILDYHRMQASPSADRGHEWGLWWDATHPETSWIANWQTLAKRYLQNPVVIGCDLFNEPHQTLASDPYISHPGPFFDGDGVNEPYNWRTAVIRAGNAILSINPKLLIIVEGLDQYDGQEGTFGPWGAIHIGLRHESITFTVPNRLLLLTKELGPVTFEQSYFKASNFPANLPAVWDNFWGFAMATHPMYLGEFGGKFDPSSSVYAQELKWFNAFRDYIAQNGISWTFWLWNPASQDTGGILGDDMVTIDTNKVNILKPIMYPGFQPTPGGSSGGAVSRTTP